MPADFPPPPWDLRGQGWLTVWTAPRSAVPLLPAGVAPLSLAGRVLVVTAFVNYGPPGLLSYRELLAAVVVRRGVRFGLSITDIWVDDETSRRGARAMWGIPKEMAEFTLSATPRLAARAHGIADAHEVTGARTLPEARADEPSQPPSGLPARLGTSVWQSLDHRTTRTPLRTSARVRRTRLHWSFTPDGPLARLTAARPRLHLAVTGLRMRFGSP
ncbi:acetoacetate decarboxylase family protein [Lentzea sp. JNUCC 0626]|uniref:acetoacetate decarboxylase family protein n=1 Tax=Lentzea sp. JNUCC 0626 TaxID=3367513 RepID=UPI0037494217